MADDKRPTGRAAVTRALLDAATHLFASRGSAAVSVRDIATEAGVNHGLVHRHFGSKEKLRRAVLHDLTERLAVDVGFDAPSVMRAIDSAAMDGYFRMLARALLDREDIGELQQSFPVVRSLLRHVVDGQAAGTIRDDVDAKALAAIGVSAALGWLLFAPFVQASLGLTGKTKLPKKLLATWFTLVEARTG